MRKSVRKSAVAAVVCALGLFTAANAANASIITVDFVGVITGRSDDPVLGIEVCQGDPIQGTLVYSTDSGGGPLNGKFSLLIGGHLLEGIDPDVPEFGIKSPKDRQYFYRGQNGDPLLDGAPVQEAYYLFAFLFPISPPIIPGDPKPASKVLDVNPPGLDAWSLVVSSGSYGYFGVGDIDFVQFSIDSVNVSAVDSAPEPATLSIWCLGALGCAAVRYRRGRKPPLTAHHPT